MSNQEYRVALIGAGMIANSAHIPAITSLGGAMKLVGVQDIREESARFTADKLDIPWYTDPRIMLEELQPDLAVITTPNQSHPELSELAMEMGSHVVCEKAVSVSYQGAKRIIDASRRTGRQFFAAQTSRFMQTAMSLMELVDMGLLGRIYYCDAESFRRRGVPRWGMFHMKEHNGGGCFSDQHMVDFLVYLNKAPRPVSVSASAYSELTTQNEQLYYGNAEAGAYGGDVFLPKAYDNAEFNVEEFGTAFIRFENNLTVQVKNAWAINLADSNGVHLRVCGDKGGIDIPSMKSPQLTLYKNMGPYRNTIYPQIIDNTNNQQGWGHWEMYEQILSSLRGERAYCVTEQEVLITALIMEMFYRSAAEKREVRTEEFVSGAIE